MSGNYTTIDTEQVMNLVNHALPIVSALEDTQKLITNEGKTLADNWKAPISDAYQGQSIPKLDENLASFLENYKDFIANLKEISSLYDKQEEETVELVEAL